VHRSIIGDLGVTTPKQLGRTFSKYSQKHPELQASKFVIPQVPGTIARSKRMKGVFEVMLTAKKYMWPIFLFHPYAAGTAVAVYVQHWHFNPGKDAPILNAKQEMSSPMTSADRRAGQKQLEELVGGASSADGETDEREWTALRTSAEPVFDVAGGPMLRVSDGREVTSVGIARSNILNVGKDSEFATGLLRARLREELKSNATRKTARDDVENDLALLQQLLALQPRKLASTGEDGDSQISPVKVNH
jgi:hypothetical protein